MEGITVYSYNPQSGVYEGTMYAPPSPEEPGRFIIHANSTELEPPTVGENQAAVFDKNSKQWILRPDYRGKIYYDTVTREKQAIKEVGVEPAMAWTELEPADPDHVWNGQTWVVPFEVQKERKKAEITAARYEAETAGIIVNGVNIATDDRSQSKLAGAAIQALIDPSYTLTWKVDTNVSVNLSASQLLAIATAVRQHVQACFDKEIALLAAANACETEASLYSIQW